MNLLWLGWEDTHTPGRIHDAASALSIRATVARVEDLCFITDGDRVGMYLGDANVVETFDIAVVRVSHPRVSESLTVARLFHDAGRAVVDESLTDEGFALSKMHDYLVLAGLGLPVPRTWQMFDLKNVESLAETARFPVVLKGIHGSYGSHVHLARDVTELRERLAGYSAGELMLQEYLPGEADYRVMAIGYQPLPVMVERTPAPNDFRTNSALGGQMVARQSSDYPEIVQLAAAAAQGLRREFAAVDIRLKNGMPVVLEVNRRPHFESFERATGYDVAGAFLAHVMQRGLA